MTPPPRADVAPTGGSDTTRVLLEAAIDALPALLRVDSCAILLPSADRDVLRTLARRQLSEPQAKAIADLLSHREVAALLAEGRPFIPRSGEGLSPELHAQLTADGWPDLIAVPLPGTGRPVGALVAVAEGEGRWTAGRTEAAMRAGVLLAVSLRAAIRAGEGERRRRQAASLLERLPLVRDRGAGREGALGAVVTGLGEALDLSHCIGLLLGAEETFAEFCRPGVTPIGPPNEIASHPMWQLLATGAGWSYEEGDSSPADRSHTARLLGGAHPRALLAVPVRHGQSLEGVLLLVQAERRRQFTEEERLFVAAAAVELSRLAGERLASAAPESVPLDVPALMAAQTAITADFDPHAIARSVWTALHKLAGATAVFLVRFDGEARRLLPLAATVEGMPELEPMPAVPLGDDLLSEAVRAEHAAGGPAARALPSRWRRIYRPQRDATALALPIRTGRGYRFALLVISPDGTALSRISTQLRFLFAPIAVSLAATDLWDRAECRERRLTALNEMLLATAPAADVSVACREATAAIKRSLPDVDLITVWLVDEGGGMLRRVSTTGDEESMRGTSGTISLDQETGTTKTVHSAVSHVWQIDDETVPAFTRRLMEGAGVASLAHVPMRTPAQAVGVLSIGSRRARAFDAEEVTFLETLGGQLAGQLAFVRARERAESERLRLAALINTLPEALMIVDADSVITLCNPAAEQILAMPLQGRPFASILGTLTVLHPDGRPYPYDDLPLVRALRGESLFGIECLCVRADASEVPLLVNVGPLRDPQGTITGAVGLFQDLTSHQELSSLKSEFVNTVSHELRTPITTIRGGAITLLKRRHLLDEQTQNELLGDIAEEGERLHLLVEDLLALTRSRSGIDVSPEPVLLRRLVDRVIIELGGRVGGHALVLNVPADLPPVNTDPTLTQQVLRNLLANAVKFSPSGQEVEIAAEQRGTVIVLSVLDRGRGVPPEEMDRVFEPFYRSPGAVQSGAQGAGLGLAVCRRLVEMQGGRIWAEPRPGGGIAFRFTVPVADDSEGG